MGGPPEDTLTRPSSNGSQGGPEGNYDDFRDDISNLSSLRISIQEPELKDIESDSDDSPNTRDQLRALRESNERLRKEHVDRCKELLEKKKEEQLKPMITKILDNRQEVQNRKKMTKAIEDENSKAIKKIREKEEEKKKKEKKKRKKD